MTAPAHEMHVERVRGRRDLTAVLAVTAAFLAVEVAGGIVSGSLALLADAGHMLHDVAALGLALFAMRFAERPATAEKTYGWYRVEILAALANGILLVLVAAGVAWEAARRLMDPPGVRGGLMLGVAVAGLCVNLGGAAILWRRRGDSPNLRAAFLHVVGDALGSVAAIVAAAAILGPGWNAADPLASAGIAVLIAVSALGLLRHTVNVLLEGTPAHIDLPGVRAAMLDVPGVASVHDLHIWTLTTGFVALSAHSVVYDDRPPQDVLVALREALREGFGIEHATIQLERPGWPDEEVHCGGDPRCLP